jgi:hypothetical protein
LGFPPATYTLTVNGQALYTFTSTGAYVGVYPASSLSGVIGVPLDQFGANNALPLAAGQEIGPGAAGYQWFSDPSFGSDLSATYDGGADGPLQVGLFTGLESAYLGLQFQEGGQTYYGWARVGVPYAGLDAVWLYDYAYETVPNTPILAGQGEVPEPATLSLLLVFGAVFWLVRKRSTALFTFNEKKPPPQIPPLPPAIEGSLLPRKGECYTLLYVTLRPFAAPVAPFGRTMRTADTPVITRSAFEHPLAGGSFRWRTPCWGAWRTGLAGGDYFNTTLQCCSVDIGGSPSPCPALRDEG